MTPGGNSLICIGKFSSPHGVKGDVKLISYTENPLDIFNYSPIYCEEKEVTLTLKKSLKENFFIIQVSGIDSRTLAEELNNKELFIDKNLLPVLENTNEFYYFKLEGSEVFISDKKIGVVNEVCDFGAGTFLEIILTNKKVATLPFNKDAVVSFDNEKCVMQINENFLLY